MRVHMHALIYEEVRVWREREKGKRDSERRRGRQRAGGREGWVKKRVHGTKR